MERLFFSPAVPPDVVLSRYEVCRTQDLEEARKCGERIFCENRLSSLDANSSLNTRIYYRRLGSIGMGRMSYGGDITIEPGELDTFTLVQMPICGQEQIECGNQRVLSNVHMGSVLNAHLPSRINHSNSTEKLIIRIDTSLLERNCQQHLGRMLRKELEFQPAMPLDTPQGRCWMRTVGWIYDSLSADDGEPSPLLAAQFEQSLVNVLLACQPHNYSAEMLASEGPVIAPSFVKKVERYIEEHAHEPISIIDMAEHAGVSSRSLFTGFRRYRNTSPMLYLKEVRLRHVQEELQRQSPGNTTVTAVAFRWGFSHLGHFTTDYKRRFGESPSETLAR
ncbi:AraC-type DNA-binding protein [Pseudomonas citronellolis]|uniref:AraC-type DNA-binding protein n=1 Tax=Pseudomonas citronellolis TaxID=53408 RepID=A0AAQ1KF30_9PSED|nr:MULTISPECIES: AraC family transcriptional regulator [Pseudomonas]MCL6693008.1 AraC family transcriptional regulator [Pseudomonas sp. R3.Fl]TGC32123.1 AraC family transcriptional regulator [Pseudomonas citronellolis]SFC64012.1 AraC-type DNA-binding protein [Pseudomonas citronellolis]